MGTVRQILRGCEKARLKIERQFDIDGINKLAAQVSKKGFDMVLIVVAAICKGPLADLLDVEHGDRVALPFLKGVDTLTRRRNEKLVLCLKGALLAHVI